MTGHQEGAYNAGSGSTTARRQAWVPQSQTGTDLRSRLHRIVGARWVVEGGSSTCGAAVWVGLVRRTLSTASRRRVRHGGLAGDQ